MKILFLSSLISFSIFAGTDNHIEPGESVTAEISLSETPESPVTFTVTASSLISSTSFSLSGTDTTVTLSVTGGLTDSDAPAEVMITFSATSDDLNFDGRNKTFRLTSVPPFDIAGHSRDLQPFDDYAYTWQPTIRLDADSMSDYRQVVIDWLFDDDELPTTGADAVTTSFSGNAYFNHPATNAPYQEKLQFDMTGGFSDYAYLLRPASPNGKLAWATYGHGDTYDINGIPDAIDSFLLRGYTVIAKHMTERGENTGPVTGGHNGFDSYSSGYSNNIQYFIEPYIRATNEALSRDSFGLSSDIVFMGISGGGWAVSWLSAIDARIKWAFMVTGTFPEEMHNRYMNDLGDYEQGYNRDLDDDGEWEDFPTGVFHRAATTATGFNRIELYIIGSHNKLNFHFRNPYDACCFASYDILGWGPKVQDWVNQHRVGRFDYELYRTPSDAHTYTAGQINQAFQLIEKYPIGKLRRK